jgi:hypothetical protein
MKSGDIVCVKLLAEMERRQRPHPRRRLQNQAERVESL